MYAWWTFPYYRYSSVPQTIRVVFRLLFTLPLLILGVDGVRPQHILNSNMIVTGKLQSSNILICPHLFLLDVLAVIAGFGCAISSGITLVVWSFCCRLSCLLMFVPYRFSSLDLLKVKLQLATQLGKRDVLDIWGSLLCSGRVRIWLSCGTRLLNPRKQLVTRIF